MLAGPHPARSRAATSRGAQAAALPIPASLVATVRLDRVSLNHVPFLDGVFHQLAYLLVDEIEVALGLDRIELREPWPSL